jgi:hypothetical protein
MQYLNEDYKNYFKKRLAESILSEEVERYEDEDPTAEAGFLRGILNFHKLRAPRAITKGGRNWVWKGNKVPDHVKKSLSNSKYFRDFEKSYRSGQSILRFSEWLEHALHYDVGTGQWFRRSHSDGWRHITRDGREIPINFDPTQGIPRGWEYSIPAGLFFELTPSDEQGTVDGTQGGTPGGIEAIAPYRQA